MQSEATEHVVTTTVDADTPWTTAAGASFVVPKGWRVTSGPRGLVLDEPDGGLSVSLFETEALDGETAIALAWGALHPRVRLAPAQVETSPAAQGWDATTRIVYETVASESRIVLALARRKGSVHYVALVNGSRGAYDRRSAQINRVVRGFKALGVAPPTLRGRAARRLDADALRALDAFVDEARAACGIPGAAFALVQDGSPGLEAGYGARALGGDAPVTPCTLFMIGSTTKPLTTLMMAALVDEGRLAWDTRVRAILPTFELGDAALAERLTIADTVSGGTGLPAENMDFFFSFSAATPESRVRSMRTLRPTTAYGETYQYSNILVALGGYAAARAAFPGASLGEAYEAAMASRVFEPLGMRASTLSSLVACAGEHALPHARGHDGALATIAVERWVDSVRPSGGAWSSARDMACALRVELAQGRRADGARLYSEEGLARRRTPKTLITDETSYGLGYFIEDDRGVRVVGHRGATFGFNAAMFFLPDHGVGAAILANAGDADAFLTAVRERVFELLFETEERAKATMEAALVRRARASAREAGREEPVPAATAAALAGAYENATLGRVALRLDERARLVLETADWRSAVALQRAGDGWTLTPIDAPWSAFRFHAQVIGEPRLTLDALQKEYVFARTGAATPEGRDRA